MKRIAIIGSSGYFGTALLKRLERAVVNDKNVEVIGIDVKKPKYDDNGFFQYYNLDIRDFKLIDVLKENKIDTLIHLVHIVEPTKDNQKKEEYDIEINGTKNILNCCEKLGIENIIYASSSKHYSKKAKIPFKETDALEENFDENGFSYGRNKVIIENLLQDYKEKHKNTRLVVFRPTHIWGKNVDNSLSRRFDKDGFLVKFVGINNLRGFIHEKDLADYFYQAASNGIDGIFNASAGSLKHSELLKMTSETLKKPIIHIPLFIAKPLVSFGWKLNLLEYGLTYLQAATRDIVLDMTKTEKVFGKPKYDAKQTFQEFLDARVKNEKI